MVPKNVLNRLQATLLHCGFGNKLVYGKDRQRDAHNLTVFWYWLACISKKTARNTVNLSSYRRLKSARSLLIPFVIRLVMRLQAGN